MPQKHNVVVYPGSGGVQQVVPPHLPAAQGDEIVFHTTAPSVTVLFPPGTPLDVCKSGWGILTINLGQTATATVNYEPAAGRYPYAVWCEDRSNPANRGFAKGGSDPEIIIYG